MAADEKDKLAGRLTKRKGRLSRAHQSAYRKALELNLGQRVRIHYYLGRALMLQGRMEEALREFENEGHEAFRLLGFALAQHARGRDAESRAALRALIQGYADGGAFQVAEAHAFRGDADGAYRWLERAYTQRDAGLASIKIDPLLRGLHADPRWLQANPQRDPILFPGHSAVLPQRPRTVTVIAASGELCRATHRAGFVA